MACSTDQFIDQSLKDLDSIISRRRAELASLRSQSEELGESTVDGTNASFTSEYISNSVQIEHRGDQMELKEERNGKEQKEKEEKDKESGVITPKSSLELRIQQLERDREDYGKLLIKINNEKKQCQKFMRVQQSLIETKSEALRNLEQSIANALTRDNTPASKVSTPGSRSARFAASDSLSPASTSVRSVSSMASITAPIVNNARPDETAEKVTTVVEIDQDGWFWPTKVLWNKRYEKLVHVVLFAILQILALSLLVLAIVIWLTKMLTWHHNGDNSQSIAIDWKLSVAHLFGY